MLNYLNYRFELELFKTGEADSIQDVSVPTSQGEKSFTGLIPGQSYKVDAVSKTFDDVRSETASHTDVTCKFQCFNSYV